MKLSFGTKLSYGIGGICDNTMYTLVSTYLLLYLTSVAGVSPGIAGGIAALGSIWESLCGPVIGALSDRTRTRFGRRKPFLLAAAFPVAVITSLLFTAIHASPTVKVVYYLVMILLFWTTFSTLFIPYMAWGSDLTEDYNERTVLRSYAYVFNQVGMCIGMVLPTVIVDYLMNLGKTTAQSWQMVGIFAGVCGGAALLLCALTIRKDDVPRAIWQAEKSGRIRETVKTEDHFSFRQTFGTYVEILKLKPVRLLLGASIVYLVANTIFSSDRVFFMTYNLGLSQKAISLIMLLITVSGVALVPLIAKMSARFDKKTVMMLGIGGAGVCMMAARFFGGKSFTFMILICLLYSAANTCYWQLMPSMLYDICEVEELYSGKKRAGAVISLQALSESLSIAAAMQALGLLLEVAGFDSEAAVQSETALTWIETCCTFVPGLFMVLVAIFMWYYPVNKKLFANVSEALKKRREGGADAAEALKKELGF